MSRILADQPGPGISRFMLSRPEARNALAPDMIVGLSAALEGALSDDKVRVIILTGDGGNFCAGGDITTMEGLIASEGLARMKRSHRLVRTLVEAYKPVIAAVEGYAVGAGAGLVMAADTVVMGKSARLVFPFLRLGLVPDYGLMYTLRRRIGDGAARQVLLYAARLEAEEARRRGLADHVVPDGDVQDKALSLAEELAAKAPVAMRMTKRMLANLSASLETVLEMEALSQSIAFSGSELPEGLAAFREKREPEF